MTSPAVHHEHGYVTRRMNHPSIRDFRPQITVGTFDAFLLHSFGDSRYVSYTFVTNWNLKIFKSNNIIIIINFQNFIIIKNCNYKFLSFRGISSSIPAKKLLSKVILLILPSATRILKEELEASHWLSLNATRGATYHMDSLSMFTGITNGLFASQLSAIMKNAYLLVLERLWSLSKKSIKSKWTKWHSRMTSTSFDIRKLTPGGPITTEDKNFTAENIFPLMKPALTLILEAIMLTEAHSVSHSYNIKITII